MEILAKVNGLAITDADVDQFLASLGARGQNYNNPQGRAMVLEQLIHQKLFLCEAMKNLYEAEPAFKAQLKQMKDSLLTNYAMEKALANITIKDEEAKKFYDENPEQFQTGEVVNASHILVDTEEKANEILAKINAGEVSFADAAKEHSSCPSSQEGGNLGEFGRGQMVPEFDQACFTMEVGTIAGPIKTQFGYHLIQLNSKKEGGTVPFEQVAPQLKEKLLMDKQQATIQSKVNQLQILFPVDRF
jgi:peptidyl-prolyl cis-trans isomerase C